MENQLENLALVADFIDKENLQLISDLFNNLQVKNKYLFIKDECLSVEKNAAWEYKAWSQVKSEALTKLKEKLYLKKSMGEKTFNDNEIQEIFSSSDDIKFDLIFVASDSNQGLDDNFLLNANYSEIYFSRKAFTKEFFDINEVIAAKDFFIATQRNFGS
ncbi:MAG: hypothetical protein HRT47_13055 [Candidatus Caenarcaniphilales bacterium]|nr:hypothetical protein [Candidatus Caenarcaniphilales bacterium]